MTISGSPAYGEMFVMWSEYFMGFIGNLTTVKNFENKLRFADFQLACSFKCEALTPNQRTKKVFFPGKH